jgi:hypothetical protein
MNRGSSSLLSRNGFSKFVGLFSPFFKLPLYGFDLAFGTPPFRASPHAQYSLAIGEPNPDGLVGSWLWIVDYLGHFARATDSNRFHNF